MPKSKPKIWFHALWYTRDNSEVVDAQRSNCQFRELHWSAETIAANNCGKKTRVVENKKLVASTQRCSSTSFGQNPEIFSIPPNDYPRASSPYLVPNDFFLYLKIKEVLRGSSFCRWRSHESLWRSIATRCRRSVPGVFQFMKSLNGEVCRRGVYWSLYILIFRIFQIYMF